MKQKPSSAVYRHLVAIALLLTMLGAAALLDTTRARAGTAHLGYGFNVAAWDIAKLEEMGFDWMKVFNAPGQRLPVNLLIRIEAEATHLQDLDGFAADVYDLAQSQGAYIEAYEIGNEVNLDADYGWGTSPVAADYVTLLCRAYEEIKRGDPASVVVSAGLAPTGRVSGTWNGHAGHNGLYQDEREYLRELLDAGGGACLDALGYHPYGFSADYDATPDVGSADPTQNCTNGFCFRGTEKIHDILQAEGWGDKPIWATEFGWLTEPPDHCLSEPEWAGRAWQIVSDEKQADNLAGAFTYADEHWPWMGPMFIFNLNFNQAPYYPECEQMRYYSVQDRPAEAALREMAKNPAPLPASLNVSPDQFSAIVATSQQPISTTFELILRNDGWQTTQYTVTAAAGYELMPVLGNATGTLSSGSETTVLVSIDHEDRPEGIYQGLLQVAASAGTVGTPQTIPLEIVVFEPTDFLFMPAIRLDP